MSVTMNSIRTGKLGFPGFAVNWKFKWDGEISNKSFGECVTSPTFVTHTFGKDIEWCLEFFPKGDKEEDFDQKIVRLKNLSSYNARIKWGFHYSKCEDDMTGYSPKLPVYIGAGKTLRELVTSLKIPKNSEITFISWILISNLVPEFENQDFAEKLNTLDSFEELLLSEKFTDLTVVSADNEKLHVYRGIIACQSPVFKDMLELDMKEKFQNIVNVDIDYEVLLELFRFFYSGKVNITDKLLFELLRAAEKYCIEDLKKQCEEVIIMGLNRQNVIQYLKEAHLNNCSNVDEILEYIVENSKDILETPQYNFLKTSHSDLTDRVSDLLQKRNLNQS